MISPAPRQRWWHADEHVRRRPFLLTRARLTAALRGWFAQDGFIEAECAALQVSPGNETHLHGFRTSFLSLDGEEQRQFYLHTSPEFAAKKLIAAGEQRLVIFARVFRNREIGPLHHPEFTLVEWYRAHAPYEALMDDCAALLRLADGLSGGRGFSFRGRTCDPSLEPERLTLADAFARHAGIDLMATLAADGSEDVAAFRAEAARIDVRTADDDSWSDVFSRILSERIEPHLGIGRATILMEYPISEAALARPKPGDPRVAERFELYACGVELANAFAELTDPVEQRRRFEADMALKQALYGESYPLDEDLLAALPVMPPTSGIALGFDRLAMLTAGAETVADVIWTPVM